MFSQDFPSRNFPVKFRSIRCAWRWLLHFFEPLLWKRNEKLYKWLQIGLLMTLTMMSGSDWTWQTACGSIHPLPIIVILQECWFVQEAEDVMFISTSTNLTQRNLSNLQTYLLTYQPNQSFNLLIDFNQLHNWDDFQYMNSKTLKDPNLQHPTAHKFLNQGNTVKMKDLGEKKSISYKLLQFLYYARFSHSGQNWTPLTHLSTNPSTIFQPWCGKHSLEAGAPTAKSWKRSTPKDLGRDNQNTAAK